MTSATRTGVLVVALCANGILVLGQTATVTDSIGGGPLAGRTMMVTAGSGLIVGGAVLGLDQAWYSQYERSSFHFFDDGAEWQGMDKVGHLFSAYTTAGWGHGLVRWTGASRGASRWMGGTIGFAFLAGVEVLDGFSQGWGFSGWDMLANVAGTGLWIGQDCAWGEQRMRIKYSAHTTEYAGQRPDLLGNGLAEQLLKDYNGQTYWLSANMGSLIGGTGHHCAGWLNAAIGYGAEGMITAHPVTGPGDGSVPFPDPRRQLFLSFDVDLERIPVRGKGWRTLLFVLNCVKIPAPALEFSSDGVVRGHWFYF